MRSQSRVNRAVRTLMLVGLWAMTITYLSKDFDSVESMAVVGLGVYRFFGYLFAFLIIRHCLLRREQLHALLYALFLALGHRGHHHQPAGG